MKPEDNLPRRSTRLRMGPAFAAGFCAGGCSSFFSPATASIFLPVVWVELAIVGLLMALIFRGLLKIFRLEAWWYRSESRALAVIGIGIVLLYFGVSGAQADSYSSDGEVNYVFGSSWWPGFFLMVAGVANYASLPTGSAYPFTAD